MLVLVGCSGSDSQGKSCSSSCTANVHFDGKTGIPLGVDPVTVSMCHSMKCLDLEVAVPASAVTLTTGGDPSLTVTVELTTDPYYPDLQGVFHFDATWSSKSEHIAAGDYVTFSVTRPDGGNVFMMGHTVDDSEVNGRCGCPSVELKH